MRLDQALFSRGLAKSRTRARELIEKGFAEVDGTVVLKPSHEVGEDSVLIVRGEDHPYVGRGGMKLEAALDRFGADPSGLVCADIGASTGGFTDVLLKNGAAKVYAVDVGSGQLDPSLRDDPRVMSLERVNARALDTAMFPERPALAVMDVSFISIRLILPAAFAVLGDAGRMIALIKPQFEAGRQAIGKGGIVSKPAIHRQVLRDIAAFVPTLGWRVRALDFSPIAGGDGNIEFLADMQPQGACVESVTPERIDEVVELAHRARL